MPPGDGGDVVFTLSPDGNSFTGRWWSGPQGGGGTQWNGTRIGAGPTPAPSPNPPPGPPSGGGGVIEPYSDYACNPMNGGFVVPAGKRASGFTAAFISYNWLACSTSYEVDTIGFTIADNVTKMAVYRYFEYKNGGSIEPDGPLASLSLGPGSYYVYVDGGPNSRIRLSFTVSP
jgi:hypothetical protein